MNQKYPTPSIYSLLYWDIQDKKIDPNFLLKLYRLFWPSFIEKNGYVFLKDFFNENELNRLISANENPEYWINLLMVSDFFSELNDCIEKSKIFSDILTSMWSAKLKIDFPEAIFSVVRLSDEDFGEYGLTFYRCATEGSDSNLKRIAIPNIKETILEESPNGPRIGISKIRKPEAWEIPK